MNHIRRSFRSLIEEGYIRISASLWFPHKGYGIGWIVLPWVYFHAVSKSGSGVCTIFELCCSFRLWATKLESNMALVANLAVPNFSETHCPPACEQIERKEPNPINIWQLVQKKFHRWSVMGIKPWTSVLFCYVNVSNCRTVKQTLRDIHFPLCWALFLLDSEAV